MKTNSEDFKLFQNECQKWINKLHLGNWEITFRHENIEAFADITSYYKAQEAIIRLATDISVQTQQEKRKMIKIHALHEIGHLLLENLWWQARARNFDSIAYQGEEHRIIHKLQRVFLEK